MNPSQQKASLVKALGDIAFLISRSIMREEFYKECYERGTSSYGRFQQAHKGYKTALESLYREILRFQAICCCYCSKNSIFRFSLDAIKWNDWGQLVAEVHDKDDKFIAAEKILSDTRLHEEHEAAGNRQRTAVNSLSAMEIALAKENASREAEEYRKLLHWLCDIDPSSMYNAARVKHEAGTCGWLVQDSDKFKAWEEGKSSLLWLHGKGMPGISLKKKK